MYAQQGVVIPVVLTTGLELGVALGITVLPATLMTLAYAFILRPRRRRHRAMYVLFAYNPISVLRLEQVL